MLTLIWCLAFIILTTLACRAHGKATAGTAWPTWGKLGCKVLVGVVAFIVSYVTFNSYIASTLLGMLTVAAMSTGHGRFYGMAGANPADNNKEWIEKNIVSKLYKGNEFKPRYSFICMGVKGLGIGLAMFPLGLTLTYIWPKAYALSIKYTNNTAPAEYITGFFFGLVAIVNIILTGV